MSEVVSNKIKNMSIVCAMLVAFIHVGRPSIVGSSGWWFYQLTAEGVSRVSVPFFFICSGYFLSKHFTDAGWYPAEIKKRIKSLIVPYLCWSLIFYLYIYVLSLVESDNPICYRVVQEMPIGSRVLLSLGLSPEKLPMLYPLWYLRFLFLMVLVSPVFALSAKYFGISMFAVLGILYIFFNPGDGSPIGVHIGFPFEGAFYFYGGILFRKHKINAYINRVDRKLAVLAGVVGVALIITRAVMLNYIGLPLWFLKPLFIPLALIALWFYISSDAWPSKLVALSFLVYVTHVFGLQLFSFIFGRDSDNVWMILGRVGFGLCFALIISYFLRNIVGWRVNLLWGGRR